MFSEILLKNLKTAKSVAILTGAGISAESGIATFRSHGGLWSKLKPEELANFDAFLKNPKLVWEWYALRREIIQEAKPNAGHLALMEMEKIFNQFTLITQNIDNLHQLAGSKNIVELHGNITRNFCVVCREGAQIEFNEKTLQKCKCGGLIRPDVVWFGEMLPPEAIEIAQNDSLHCDVFLCIGTSGVVFPAAGLPLMAKQNGAFVVEINPEETEISNHFDECIQEPSAVALPLLLERLRKN